MDDYTLALYILSLNKSRQQQLKRAIKLMARFSITQKDALNILTHGDRRREQDYGVREVR